MATFVPISQVEPIEISKFLGLNEAVGDTEVNLGEATRQVNFRITQNYKPQKRSGYATLINTGGVKNIQGMWYGTLAAKKVLIFCNNGKVYKYDMTTTNTDTALADLIADGDVTQIGTMTDAKTTIFFFESKLYFLNGTEYKEYDGTTFQDVDPYIPTIAIGTPPAGGGTAFEPINLLTGKKKQEFLGDGATATFICAESGWDDDAPIVTVGGVTKTKTTDYTVDKTAGTVTFTSSTPGDEVEVIIQWTKVASGNADLVKKNKYAMDFGPGNDTAIFLWGNPSQPNRRMWSGTLKANYFPVINYTYVGTNETAITDIIPQYSRQVIFKQDSAYFSYAEWNDTADAWDYPVYDLNEKVGNVAYGQAQLIKNNPVSLFAQSFWEWNSTAVEDERNANIISHKIKESLSDLDLSTAITFDYQKEKELWINVGDDVYVYNYGNGTFYAYDNIEASCFIDVDGVIYFGTGGTIERMCDVYSDNGTAITAQLELGFEDWGSLELRKNSREVYVSIVPESKTSLNLYYKTNRLNNFKEISKEIKYSLMDFDNIDFDDFSFLTNRNPQSFRRKIRAKKYTHIQFMFENKELNEPCTIIGFKVATESQGKIR